jgi:hypothetical protein
VWGLVRGGRRWGRGWGCGALLWSHGREHDACERGPFAVARVWSFLLWTRGIPRARREGAGCPRLAYPEANPEGASMHLCVGCVVGFRASWLSASSAWAGKAVRACPAHSTPPNVHGFLPLHAPASSQTDTHAGTTAVGAWHVGCVHRWPAPRMRMRRPTSNEVSDHARLESHYGQRPLPKVSSSAMRHRPFATGGGCSSNLMDHENMQVAARLASMKRSRCAPGRRGHVTREADFAFDRPIPSAIRYPSA